jgi:hypothetical protein
MIYEVEYKVYRFQQWWKNSYAIELEWNIDKELLTEIAYDFDKWDIKDLTYTILWD